MWSNSFIKAMSAEYLSSRIELVDLRVPLVSWQVRILAMPVIEENWESKEVVSENE
jgi:hypothetical protein